MAFDELYQEIIRDHYKNPRNKKRLDHLKAVENPSCGDSVKLEFEGGQTLNVFFDGSGCSISMCSASMMSEILSGKTVDQARAVVRDFLGVMKGEKPVELLDELGDIAALKGVIDLPVRAKCATLAWNAAEEALARL